MNVNTYFLLQNRDHLDNYSQNILKYPYKNYMCNQFSWYMLGSIVLKYLTFEEGFQKLGEFMKYNRIPAKFVLQNVLICE